MDKNIEILFDALQADAENRVPIKMTDTLHFNPKHSVSNLFFVYSRMYSGQKAFKSSIDMFNKLQKCIDKIDFEGFADLFVFGLIDNAKTYFNYSQEELEKLKVLVNSSTDTSKTANQVTKFLTDTFRQSGLRQVDLYFNNQPVSTIDSICKNWKVGDARKSIEALCVEKYVPAVLAAANFFDEFIPKNLYMDFASKVIDVENVEELGQQLIDKFTFQLRELLISRIYNPLKSYFKLDVGMFKNEIDNIVKFFSNELSTKMFEILENNPRVEDVSDTDITAEEIISLL